MKPVELIKAKLHWYTKIRKSNENYQMRRTTKNTQNIPTKNMKLTMPITGISMTRTKCPDIQINHIGRASITGNPIIQDKIKAKSGKNNISIETKGTLIQIKED